jgi:hypothetical protein
MSDDPESLLLRPTVIAGQRYPDDFVVIWRGVSIGRIMRGASAPHDRPQWIWSYHLHGRPQGGGDRGSATDLDDAKAKFKEAKGQDSREPHRSGHCRRAADHRDQRGSAG